jgi:hypothetical protein
MIGGKEVYLIVYVLWFGCGALRALLDGLSRDWHVDLERTSADRGVDPLLATMVVVGWVIALGPIAWLVRPNVRRYW